MAPTPHCKQNTVDAHFVNMVYSQLNTYIEQSCQTIFSAKIEPEFLMKACFVKYSPNSEDPLYLEIKGLLIQGKNVLLCVFCFCDFSNQESHKKLSITFDSSQTKAGLERV